MKCQTNDMPYKRNAKQKTCHTNEMPNKLHAIQMKCQTNEMPYKWNASQMKFQANDELKLSFNRPHSLNGKSKKNEKDLLGS